MSCARCGSGVYKTEEIISLNKVWHKCCFTCLQCSQLLDKDTAKIFQGELFCQCCYSSVIKQLFEVISTPLVRKPSRVVSTPSCTVSKSFLQNLVTCRPCCDNIELCFPKEEKCPNNQRTVRSCSCIPNQAKNEFCFTLPLPREVANYYNRAHMKNRPCNNKPCCNPPQCQNLCCAEPKPKLTVRTCKNQNFYENCPAPPRCSNPRKCCCNKSPPCVPLFPSDCCQEHHSCNACQSPQSLPCRHCQNQSCPRAQCGSTPKCYCSRPAPVQWCPPSERCPPKPSCCPPKTRCCPPKPQCCPPKPQCCPPKPQCCPPKPQCCPPKPQYYLPKPQCCPPQPQCCPPKPQCCSPKPQCFPPKPQCCPQKPQACCCECNPPPACCLPAPKYCICGNRNPCNCKMAEIKALCCICCKRCNKKVYAAEKIQVTAGAYHTNCFTCYCCRKYLDVKTVYEGCGEIYCKQCYNHFFNIQYYGF